MSFILDSSSKNLSETSNQKLDNIGIDLSDNSLNKNKEIKVCSPIDENSNNFLNKKAGKDEINGELLNNIMNKKLSVASNKKENVLINNDITNENIDSNNNNNTGNNKSNNNEENNNRFSELTFESAKIDNINEEKHNSTKNLNKNDNKNENLVNGEGGNSNNTENKVDLKSNRKKSSNGKSGRLSPAPEGKRFKRFETNPYKISNRHIYNISSFNELQVKIFDFLHDISKHLVKYNKDFALIQKYKHYVSNKEWAAVKISEFNLVILMKLLQYPTIIIDNSEIITLIKWLCIKNIQTYFEKILKKNSDGLNEQALVEDKTFFNYLNLNNKSKCIVNLIKYSRNPNRIKRNPEQYYYLTSIKYTNTIVVREYRIFVSLLANALHYAITHKKSEIKAVLEKDNKLVEALKFYNSVNDNEIDTIKNLFKNITYFDILNTEGLNPVSLAVKKGYTHIAKYLIDTEEYDINDRDKNGSSSLILAVIQENTDLIDKLLEHPGIRVNLKDKNGNSAFFLCSKILQ